MKLAFVRLCLSKAELLGPPARLQKGRWQRGAGGEGARKYRQVREKKKKKDSSKSNCSLLFDHYQTGEIIRSLAWLGIIL